MSLRSIGAVDIVQHDIAAAGWRHLYKFPWWLQDLQPMLHRQSDKMEYAEEVQEDGWAA